MKQVVDSTVSSGPHRISLSTTMDDEVFTDATLREAGRKSPDSQDDLSERSLAKVSPGAVTQEVSQAIIDKKGTLIILKEAEGERIFPGEVATEGDKMSTAEEREDTPALRSPKKEMINGDIAANKGVDSPKKAMAAWIYEEVKTEVPPQVVSGTTEEARESETPKTPRAVQQVAVLSVEEDQSKISLCESTATSVAGVLYKY